MSESFVTFVSEGLTATPLWLIVTIFLIATQITVLSVTLYLHRCMAHRGVDMHPLVTHPMRFWLWLTTGMVTREWVAVHRKHHARCETDEDPHSPQAHGLPKVLFHGVSLYTVEARKQETLEKYGKGCPDDWAERWLYRVSWLGPTYLLFIDVALFGAIGLTFWALQMIWIPFFAAGVINGIGHFWGYRNYTTDDAATNISPWGVFLGGEELHNNHHAFPSSARFSAKQWEFDIGWAVLRGLEMVGLAKVLRVAPQLVREDGQEVDIDTLRTVFVHRFEVMTDYCREVIKPLVEQEASRARGGMARMRGRARKLLTSDERFFSAKKQQRLREVLDKNTVLATAYEYRQRLSALWDRSTTDPEKLLAQLREWREEAEQSGIEALRKFSESLPRYRMATP